MSDSTEERSKREPAPPYVSNALMHTRMTIEEIADFFDVSIKAVREARDALTESMGLECSKNSGSTPFGSAFRTLVQIVRQPLIEFLNRMHNLLTVCTRYHTPANHRREAVGSEAGIAVACFGRAHECIPPGSVGAA